MDRLWALLLNVTSEILETMYFLFIEPSEAGDEAELRAQWHGSGMKATVVISGPQTFHFGIALPAALGQEMAKNFLGLADEEIDPDSVLDVVKESVNMIGGSLLASLKNASDYKLGLPRGQIIPLESVPNRGALIHMLNVNGQPLEIFISAEK